MFFFTIIKQNMKLRIGWIALLLTLAILIYVAYKKGLHVSSDGLMTTMMIKDGKEIPGKPAKLFETKRVYLSASMFNLEDVIYAIGVNGLLPGLRYSAMDFDDVICLDDAQLAELELTCKKWDVPMNGVVWRNREKGLGSVLSSQRWVSNGWYVAGSCFNDNRRYVYGLRWKS